MQNYDLLIDRIVKASGLDKEEIERKVEAKKAKLSGLISREGAAQIIAAELGVSFENLDIKISEIMPGMRKVNIVGKIIQIFPVREFEKNGRTGKVANFRIADETGNCRVVLWDINHIVLIENEEIKEGSVVEILNASSRDGGEIHLSGFSELKKSNKVIDEVKTENVLKDDAQISSLVNGQGVKIRGIIVQIFPIRFYNVCPECNKKVSSSEENFVCSEHGEIIPQKRGILNFILDDGTECIRCVLFSDAINKLGNEDELDDLARFEAFKKELLGSEIYILGNVKKNSFFNNLEIIGNDIEFVDIEKLINELEVKN